MLAGHDTLAVMPTGSGKSASIRSPAPSSPASPSWCRPLIALQQDQVEAIAEMDAGGAALLNSALPAAERDGSTRPVRARVQPNSSSWRPNSSPTRRHSPACKRASLRSSSSTRPTASASGVTTSARSTFASALSSRRSARPRVLALTATASPPVRREIVERLGMREPRIVVRGFDRPNIRLAVEGFSDEEDKRQALIARVVDAPSRASSTRRPESMPRSWPPLSSSMG